MLPAPSDQFPVLSLNVQPHRVIPMPAAQTALLTDLYQLNMLAAYLDHGLTDTAVFELFVRKLPTRRGFLMAAGLEEALGYLEAPRLAVSGFARGYRVHRHAP